MHQNIFIKMTKRKVLNIINNYYQILISLLTLILNKYDIVFDEKQGKGAFLENFWKLYTEKKIQKKGVFIFDDRTIEYNFHGSGCFLKTNNFEIDSNYYNKNNQFSINFGVNILWDFIEKNGLLTEEDSCEALSEVLEKLCEENKIHSSTYPPFKMYFFDLELFNFGVSKIIKL